MQGAASEGDFNRNFGESLRRIRETKGWSQRLLADVLEQAGLKLDPSAITRIERGAREVKLREAVAMASALGVDISRLIHEDESPPWLIGSKYMTALQKRSMARSELGKMATELLQVAQLIDRYPKVSHRMRFDGTQPTSGMDFLRKIAADPSSLGDKPAVQIDGDDEARDTIGKIVAAAALGVVDLEPPGATLTEPISLLPAFEIGNLLDRVSFVSDDPDT